MRRSRKRSAASRPPIRNPRANCSTSIRSPCWWRWCCRRRRPMPASTRRRPRCSRPPTRRQRWWRSARSRVRELIKTIGLFRTKAKNVVELSRMLVDEHGGEVPRSREALEALPGRRAQDRQCGAQYRLRRADHRGRHPYFPRRQPHRTGAGEKSARGRAEARAGGAGALQAATPIIGLSCTGATLAWRASRCASAASSPTCANGRRKTVLIKAFREKAYGRLGARKKPSNVAIRRHSGARRPAAKAAPVWLNAVSHFGGNFKRDAAAGTQFWRGWAAFLSKLPKKPPRTVEQQLAADIIRLQLP